jgi:hypothetical protein
MSTTNENEEMNIDESSDVEIEGMCEKQMLVDMSKCMGQIFLISK